MATWGLRWILDYARGVDHLKMPYNILERKVTPWVRLGNTLERMATCE